MKRILLDAVTVIADATATAIDRDGYLSAVVGIKIKTLTGTPTAASLAVKLQHCDTSDGSFADVSDDGMYAPSQTVTPEAGEVYQLQYDLLACKRYITVVATPTFTGGTSPALTAEYAIALGDKAKTP